MKNNVIGLACGFALSLLMGCSDDGNGDEIDQLFEKQAAEMTAARDKFCTCAADKETDLCTKEPDTCSDSKDACLSDIAKNPESMVIPTKEQISCVKQELSTAPDELQAFTTCFKDAATEFNNCLRKVSKCNYDAVMACGDTLEHTPCMVSAKTAKVDAALQKCSS